MRAAVVGLGQIARQHLACLRELPDVEIAAVCDLSSAVAESTAERFGVPSWFTDHRAMLCEVRPDVVHVTTPATSHFRLGMDALDAGAHLIVEKPATATLNELEVLAAHARELGHALVEDHNVVFNRAPRLIMQAIESGEFGTVTHVEVVMCLDILGADGFADPNSPHPSLALAGGAITDFLPHLASLTYLFVGRHRSAHTVWAKRGNSVLPYDEFRALVNAERGTASLVFSARSRPDQFWLRVYGERMQATANLYMDRLTFDGPRPGPKQLRPVISGIDEGQLVVRAALGTLVSKFRRGHGTYEGLWELLARTYRALATGDPLPVPPEQVLEVNRLVAALKPEDAAR